MRSKFNAVRRRVLAQSAALGASALWWRAPVQAAANPAGAGTRLAFLLGNRDYPPPQDLPPIPKNVRDLKAALENKGFAVTDALNLDLARSRAAIAAFALTVSAAPPDATIFFYFSGHGVQDDARNLLVSAGVNPGQLGEVQKGSLELAADVVGPLAPRAAGATYAVIDTCRVSIRAAVRDKDGLNQVEAPVGCLIAFSTGAGKPAIAPAVETQNTFYTASLVKVLNAASDNTSFKELFEITRKDVRETMLNHPVSSVRLLAQDPFIADNTQITVPMVARAAPPDPGITREVEEALWAKIQQSVWPSEIVRLASAYLEQFPAGPWVQSVQVALDGARESAKQIKPINLGASAFRELAATDEATRRDILRAARGDKDAAKRVGLRYKDAPDGSTEAGRYLAFLQYASALGNGIASYDVALLYRRRDQGGLAGTYETRAREQGYTPPQSLGSKRN